MSSYPRWKDSPVAKAKKLNQEGADEAEREIKARQKQIKRPWLRQDADKPPVEETENQAHPLTKGTTVRPWLLILLVESSEVLTRS